MRSNGADAVAAVTAASSAWARLSDRRSRRWSGGMSRCWCCFRWTDGRVTSAAMRTHCAGRPISWAPCVAEVAAVASVRRRRYSYCCCCGWARSNWADVGGDAAAAAAAAARWNALAECCVNVAADNERVDGAAAVGGQRMRCWVTEWRRRPLLQLLLFRCRAASFGRCRSAWAGAADDDAARRLASSVTRTMKRPWQPAPGSRSTTGGGSGAADGWATMNRLGGGRGAADG